MPDQVLLDVVRCLDEVTARQLPPAAAHARVMDLQQQYVDTDIDLVWEDEAFDGSYHYDALLRREGDNKTISVSVCRDDALPWALRGLQRWRDSDLLRVNETVLSVEDAITQLDVLWENAPLMRRLIDSCIVETELRRRNVTVDRSDVQTAFDDMRRRRGLLSAEAMNRWMADSGVSLHALQDMAEKVARANKLRELIVAEHFERYLKDHADEFEVVSLAVLQLPTLEKAGEFVALLGSAAANFTQLAQQTYVEDASGRTALSFRKEPRYKLAEEFGSDVAFRPGVLVTSPSSTLVLYVMGVDQSMTTEQVRQRAKMKLFDEWLREQRRSARIEWFWGDAKRTAAASE